MKKSIALAAALFVLNGCYFSRKKDDRPWPIEVVSQIEVGKTTKAEVLQLLGPPKQIIRLLESEAYMYVASVEKSSGLVLVVLNLSRNDRQYDAVTVIINRQDVVTAVGARFSADDAAYGLPWD
jgi:outer membrane protein assembly factor BamE (lipoprotein component of BamABCDE complex)